jgi:hypothetical protein
MPTISWDVLAKNHIPSRNWAAIRSVWASASLGFEASEISDLSAAVTAVVGADLDDRSSMSTFPFPGGHVAAFHDVAASFLRCAYVLRATANCLLGGQPTWASVDAYHFSFLAGKTLLAFLGLHFVQVKDTHCVVDVFPKGISRSEISKYTRESSGRESAARLLFRARSEVIAQSAIWAIVTRALRVTSLDDTIASDVDKLNELGTGFSRSRNEILYRNNTWPFREDFENPTRSVTINDDIFSYGDLSGFFLETRDANFAFASLIARIVLFLVRDITSIGGTDLFVTSYGRCMAKFTSFVTDELDNLLSSIYRKDCYGLIISEVHEPAAD